MRAAWGAPNVKLLTEEKAVLWRAAPFTCKVWMNSR